MKRLCRLQIAHIANADELQTALVYFDRRRRLQTGKSRHSWLPRRSVNPSAF
jgi:hypothetical protein